MDKLFSLLYKFSDGTRLKIEAFHTGKFDSRMKSKITIRAIQLVDNEIRFKLPIQRVLLDLNDTYYCVSPMHSDDSTESKKLATELVCYEDTEKPMSQDRKDFVHKYGDELSMIAGLRYE